MTTNTTPTRLLAIMGSLAVVGACSLLGLQIIGGLEYTEGGSLYTRASMIAAMVTLAALPMFIEAARHLSKGLVLALGVSFVAFLAYSLPATTGRTGEIKETKATEASDIASAKAELASITQTLGWARPDKIAECLGAPDPLPPTGWPKCRQKTGTVSALEDRQKKLEAQTQGTAKAQTGDLGSEIWAWALSFAGVTATFIRKSSVLSFAVGLDMVIWSLGLFAHLAFKAVFAARAAAAAVDAPKLAITERPEGEPTDREIEELKRIMAKLKGPVTNDELAAKIGVSKAETSKRVTKAVHAGVLARERTGREVAVRLLH